MQKMRIKDIFETRNVPALFSSTLVIFRMAGD